MSLPDCLVCWENICLCGENYKTWTTSEIEGVRDVLNKILLDRSDKSVKDENEKLKDKIKVLQMELDAVYEITRSK